MDRAHRIGQTRDVLIYRLISEHTVEENIWRRQLQKRQLDDVVVDEGKFTTDSLQGVAGKKSGSLWTASDVQSMLIGKERSACGAKGGDTDGLGHLGVDEFEQALRVTEDADDVEMAERARSE